MAGHANVELVIRASWGADALAFWCFNPPKTFRLGDDPATSDFALGKEQLGSELLPLAEVREEGVVIHGLERPLAEGESARVELGGLSFEVSLETASPGWRRQWLDHRTLALVVCFVSTVALFGTFGAFGARAAQDKTPQDLQADELEVLGQVQLYLKAADEAAFERHEAELELLEPEHLRVLAAERFIPWKSATSGFHDARHQGFYCVQDYDQRFGDFTHAVANEIRRVCGTRLGLSEPIPQYRAEWFGHFVLMGERDGYPRWKSSCGSGAFSDDECDRFGIVVEPSARMQELVEATGRLERCYDKLRQPSGKHHARVNLTVVQRSDGSSDLILDPSEIDPTGLDECVLATVRPLHFWHDTFWPPSFDFFVNGR